MTHSSGFAVASGIARRNLAAMRFSFVTLMTNRRNGVLYVGITSDLVRRVSEHRTGALPGFTKRYGLKTLVWFEVHEDITAAIARERS